MNKKWWAVQHFVKRKSERRGKWISIGTVFNSKTQADKYVDKARGRWRVVPFEIGPPIVTHFTNLPRMW